LHDLGLVLNATWISHDLRFEVDSSIRATEFVEETAKHDGTSFAWNANRLQLLYDAILLSSEPKFSLYKQATVKVLVEGVLLDLGKPDYGVTIAEYQGVEAAFPPLNFITGVNHTLVQLCVQKPNSTFGE
jgi:hypothetical protein